jgi:hypothetical protein
MKGGWLRHYLHFLIATILFTSLFQSFEPLRHLHPLTVAILFDSPFVCFSIWNIRHISYGLNASGCSRHFSLNRLTLVTISAF